MCGRQEGFIKGIEKETYTPSQDEEIHKRLLILLPTMRMSWLKYKIINLKNHPKD